MHAHVSSVPSPLTLLNVGMLRCPGMLPFIALPDAHYLRALQSFICITCMISQLERLELGHSQKRMPRSAGWRELDFATWSSVTRRSTKASALMLRTCANGTSRSMGARPLQNGAQDCSTLALSLGATRGGLCGHPMTSAMPAKDNIQGKCPKRLACSANALHTANRQ